MKNKIIPIITAMVLIIMAFFIVLQDGNHYALEADGE